RFSDVPRMSAEQIQLLNLIDEIAYDPKFYVEFRQKPGDINYVKNSSVLHMRTSFEDHPEPKRKRHLIRMWLTAHGRWVDSDKFIRKGIPVKDGVISDEADINLSDT
ncbi:MAG: TauD/TfdA family dioxygenase, partial [Gammaproteobacteria bacterium]|nr:TauD/TfdA family dioxygenase [Gammaproteobacteria bacterium]